MMMMGILMQYQAMKFMARAVWFNLIIIQLLFIKYLIINDDDGNTYAMSSFDIHGKGSLIR